MSDQSAHSSPHEYSHDEHWMREALAQARLCLRSNSSNFRDDVPIGAVCVLNNQIISRGHNQRELDNDPTGARRSCGYSRGPHEYSIAATCAT
jgi:tRNA(Arg) A34 adenosine deaminase TadA